MSSLNSVLLGANPDQRQNKLHQGEQEAGSKAVPRTQEPPSRGKEQLQFSLEGMSRSVSGWAAWELGEVISLVRAVFPLYGQVKLALVYKVSS